MHTGVEMDKPIRFALITYGKVARLHARALRSIPGAQLVAVYGRDPAKREAFAAEFGIQPMATLQKWLPGVPLMWS
jgi:UDP-N-acetyl-2-amino-2-deoxyglucuronate dehydrogenase